MPRTPLAYGWIMFTAAGAVAVLAAAAAAETPSSFGASIPSTRLQAMGGAFSPLGDDITALAVNPAGLVTTGGTVLYGGYAERGGSGRPWTGSFAAAHERWSTVFCAAASRTGRSDGTVEGLIVAGAARNIIEGSAGSFLSVGAAVRIGRVSFDWEPECPLCSGERRSSTVATADAGLMIRPLPFISLAVASDNLFETGFDVGADEIPWHRTVRFGAAWLHEDRFAVTWEQRRTGGRASGHFGFGIRTALPLEIMAGYSSERVSGGIRWDGGRWRAAAAFSEEPAETIEVTVSLEVFFDRPVRITQ